MPVPNPTPSRLPGNERSHTNRARAESFGPAAEEYDRVRPGYPATLIDDLVTDGPTAALDIGCGTGKAARLLAARGLTVLGVEIDPRMAEVARRHGVPVEVAAFEQWDPAGRHFDLAVCGQAWHWIDGVAGAAKVAQVLRPGRLLAMFWNFTEPDTQAQRALDAAYRDVAPLLGERSVLRGAGKGTVPPLADTLRASGRFRRVEQREYPWTCDYTRDEWLALARTHSDHATLPPRQLDDLLAAVGATIDAIGGALHIRYRTYALLARVR